MGESTNRAVGKTKKAFGRATHDRGLEPKGRLQETTGKVQGGVRKGARKVEDTIDDVGRKVNKRRRLRERPSRRAP